MADFMKGLLSDPMFNMGIGLLSQGYTTMPTTLGQNLSSGLLYAQRAQQAQQQEEVKRAQLQAAQAKMAQEAAQAQARQQFVQSLPPEQRAAAMVNPEAFAKPQDQGQPKVVGNDLVSPSGALLYRAPQRDERPPQKWVQVPDPKSPSGYSYQLAAPGMPAAPSGTSLEVGPDGSVRFSSGNQPMERTTKKDLEAGISTAMENLVNLQGISDNYKGEYLTYGSGIRSWLARNAERAGAPGMVPNEWREALGGRTKFKTGVEQFFNMYRTEITGAAASVAELDRLKTSMLNADMSPTEFESAFNQFVKIARNQLEAKRRMLAEGVEPTAERLDAEFARLGVGGHPKTAADKLRELEAQLGL